MERIKKTEGYQKFQRKHEEKLAELKKPVDPKKVKPWRVGKTLTRQPFVSRVTVSSTTRSSISRAIRTTEASVTRWRGRGMNREEIKMLAALRALECEKTYLESELSRILLQSSNPDHSSYQRPDIAIFDVQERLIELKREFEEI